MSLLSEYGDVVDFVSDKIERDWLIDAAIQVAGLGIVTVTGGGRIIINWDKYPRVTRIPVPDDLPKTVHTDGQGKHIPGHKNYDPTRSTLTADANELLAGIHSGKYPIVRQIKRGNSTTNIVDFGKSIDKFKNSDGIIVGSTRYGQIVQSKHGAHIIPANPNQY